jgi:hypothetical protein
MANPEPPDFTSEDHTQARLALVDGGLVQDDAAAAAALLVIWHSNHPVDHPGDAGNPGNPPDEPPPDQPIQGIACNPPPDVVAALGDDQPANVRVQPPPFLRDSKVMPSETRMPHADIIKKLLAWKWVELWWFTQQGLDFAASQKFLVRTPADNQQAYGIIISPDGGIKAAPPPIPDKCCRDSDLTWTEFVTANRVYTACLQELKWSRPHVVALIRFFDYIENSKHATNPQNHHALLLYCERIRRDWFTSLESQDPLTFDISVRNDDLLDQHMADTLREEQMKAMAAVCFAPSSAPSF